MARNKYYVLTPSTPDADGIALAQQLVGAGNLTLAGAEASGGSWTNATVCTVNGRTGKVGHQLAVYSAGNISTVIFTVTGTCPDGRAITDTVTGVNNSTVETTKYFYKVSSIAADAAVGSDVTVGTSDECITSIFPVSARGVDQYTLAVDITGTINYDIENTFANIYTTTSPQTLAWQNHSELAGETTSQHSYIEAMATAVRFITNSYTGGATVKFAIIPNTN